MTSSPAAKTPEPPYYIVTFASRRTAGDHGYDNMGEEMERLAREQPGFLGLESVRGADGFGLTNSYWADEESIAAWKNNVRHLTAQRLGRERWYEDYQVRVGKIERQYGFERP
jgi:heme-degrading monooxygenase HmoA